MTYKVAIILINYHDYAKKYLGDCWSSLKKIQLASADWQLETQIFIVDNDSSEESLAYLQVNAPEARLLANKNNDGFAKGNNDALAIAMAEGFDFAWVLNMDTVVTENSLLELVTVAIRQPKAGAIQSLLSLWPKSELVNSLGNAIHFLGYGYCLGYRQPTQSLNLVALNDQPIAYPSGASVLLRISALRQIGLFDEVFWMYNEDQDLGWRLWLSGWECRLATASVVSHKYEFSRSTSKYYWLDRNRILAAWKNYHWLTIILLLPALIGSDLVLAILAWRSGRLKQKLQTWFYFISPLNWPKLLKMRHQTQRLRTKSDRQIVKMFVGRISFQEAEFETKLIAFGNFCLNFYWQVVKLVIFW
ncbi:MAG TPA: glycosyltransferase family 2 protein [bacterium]|nr:glycosyltransferase family 2 protein [bacterium]